MWILIILLSTTQPGGAAGVATATYATRGTCEAAAAQIAKAGRTYTREITAICTPQ